MQLFLSQADLLAPIVSLHPFEQFLIALKQSLSVPKRNWPFLLLITITLAISSLLVLNEKTLSQQNTIIDQELGFLVSLALVAHLLLQQPELRWLIIRLWQDGESQLSISRLTTLFAWHQGWPLGAWLFVILAVGASVISLVFIPNLDGRSLAEIARLFANLALIVLYWGWFWAGLFCYELAAIMSRTTEVGTRSHYSMTYLSILKEKSYVLEKAKWIALQWIMLASFFVSWQWGHTKSDLDLLHWSPVLVPVLVALWLGYAHLEFGIMHLARESYRARGEDTAGSEKQRRRSYLLFNIRNVLFLSFRVGFSLALTILPIWVLTKAG